MYRILPHICSMSSVSLHNPGTEVAGSIQPADISYFVLIPSKIFQKVNGGQMFMNCVVHFSANVVYVFKCPTPRNRNYVAPLKP